MRIEIANINDHKILTELTKKSKAYWGYSKQLIRKWNDDLTITQDYIEKNKVVKLSIDNKIIGYYSYLMLNAQIVKLDNIFINPDYIGKGYGKFLMNDFIANAKKEGFLKITLDSEPNAEGFYKNFGFTVVQKLESSIKDRFLPIMEKSINI